MSIGDAIGRAATTGWRAAVSAGGLDGLILSGTQCREEDEEGDAADDGGQAC